MLNKLRSVRLGSKGFTLVELLVVIAILGILAAIVIPKLMGQNDAARVAKVKADLATMEQATQIYSTQQSVQATTIASLVGASLLVATPVAPATFTVNNPIGTPSISFTDGAYAFSARAGNSRPAFIGAGSYYMIEDISTWN